jgi:hypothetical protein
MDDNKDGKIELRRKRRRKRKRRSKRACSAFSSNKSASTSWKKDFHI